MKTYFLYCFVSLCRAAALCCLSLYLCICLFIYGVCVFVVVPAGKPQIVEKTEDGVTLTWTRSTKIGASSVVGYTVEMYGRNATENWIPIAHRVQNTTYTHTGLIPGVSYFFVIRAENAHGMSAPSPLSEPVVLGLVSDLISVLSVSTFFFALCPSGGEGRGEERGAEAHAARKHNYSTLLSII